jgi:PAS domain S-box-containing protein
MVMEEVYMGESLRILIVEDSEDDALLMLAELKRGGFDPVFIRVETPEAMSSALRDRVWDIVVSDYVMPRFSGLAALKLLQEAGLDLPFIVVSGHIGEDIAVDAMKAGAHDYILKGHYSRLVPAINRELREAAIRNEKAQSEQALRESEERFRSLFENMLDGYAYCEGILENNQLVDFKYVAVNSALYRLTGLANITGKKISEVIPGLRVSNPRLFEIYGNVIKSGIPEKFEEYLEPLGIYLSICVYSTGKKHFVAVFENITERKLAEETLRESESNLREAQEIARLGRWELNRISNHLSWSDGIFNLFETDRETFTASYEAFLDYIHPDDRAMVNKAYHESVVNHRPYDIEHRLLMKDGRVKWVSEIGRTVYDAAGNPIYSRGTVQDITERKQAEQALRNSEQRLDMAQNAANIGVWDWNLLTGHIEWSSRMFDLFGLDPVRDTASFEAWQKTIHPEDIEIAAHRIDQALRQRTSLNSDYRIVMPDGEVRWINATGEGKYDRQGKPVRMIGICMDITERKQTEAALLRAGERDRHIADVLQQTVMPSSALMQPDGYQIAARYQPALTEAEVCGDFCDVFDLGDGKIGIGIGDVVGKGLLGAVRVTAARNAIRCYAYLDNDPASVMTLVNDALSRDITTENDMLTAFFAELNTFTGVLRYCNAGHEPPIVRHSNGLIESLATGGPMFVGMGSQLYREGEIHLGEGDLFVMVTDGITEARNVGYAEQFGAEGIAESVSANVSMSADQIAERLLESASSFVNEPLRDDAAIVVIKVVNKDNHK